MEELKSVKELCELYDVKLSITYSWIYFGKLQVVKIKNRNYTYESKFINLLDALHNKYSTTNHICHNGKFKYHICHNGKFK